MSLHVGEQNKNQDQKNVVVVKIVKTEINPVRSTHNIIITSGIPLCIYVIITNNARDIIEREITFRDT